MRQIKLLAATALIALSVAGCRKDSPSTLIMSEKYYTQYTENYWENLFQTYWEAMNQSYALWALESIDWDEIYEEYTPRFRALDQLFMDDEDDYFTLSHSFVDNDDVLMCKGDSIGVTAFQEITSQITDYHYVLDLYNQNVYGRGYYYEEIRTRDYYHGYDTDFYSGLAKTITADIANGSITDHCSGSYYNSDIPTTPLYMHSYRIDDDIAYLYLSKFALYSSSDTPLDRRDNTMNEVLDNFESIIRNTPTLKGAIIDVRNNTGGYTRDLGSILGRFINVDDEFITHYTRHKNGPNRLDYTSYVPTTLDGKSETESISFPIAVLTNLYSISMSEVTCFVARAFSPQSVVVGERTYGATCGLYDTSIFSGGYIENDNFLIYTVSAISYYGEDKQVYEGIGATPDIEVLDDTDWGTTTVDLQKQAAVDYLLAL